MNVEKVSFAETRYLFPEYDMRTEHSKVLSKGSMREYHSHMEYELAILIQGAGRCYIGADIINMNAGRVYVINSSEFHMMTYSDAEPHVMYHIYFRQNIIDELRTESGIDVEAILRAHITTPLKDEFLYSLTALANAAARESQSLGHTVEAEQCSSPAEAARDQFARAMCRLLTKSIVLDVARYIQREDSAQPFETTHPVISAVLGYINEHYAEEISLSGLADEFARSRNYLCRLFRAETGFTLTEYVNSMRIQRACKLMRESRLSVSEIGARTGFNSLAYFDRIFRTHTGVSPTDYINGLRK